MAQVAENVRVALTGAMMVAPIGTALPGDADVKPNEAFVDVGYIHADGVTQTIDAETTDIKAFQNGDIVRTIQTSHKVTFSFTMIETNDVSLKLYYADPDGTVKAVKLTGRQSPHNEWVFDVLDGDYVIRIVIPNGQIVERGEVTYKNDDAIGYPVTVAAYPDDDGVKAYIYQAKALLPAA